MVTGGVWRRPPARRLRGPRSGGKGRRRASERPGQQARHEAAGSRHQARERTTLPSEDEQPKAVAQVLLLKGCFSNAGSASLHTPPVFPGVAPVSSDARSYSVLLHSAACGCDDIENRRCCRASRNRSAVAANGVHMALSTAAPYPALSWPSCAPGRFARPWQSYCCIHPHPVSDDSAGTHKQTSGSRPTRQ